MVSTTKRWTWRRVAEDNQAQLNTALDSLQTAQAAGMLLRGEVDRLKVEVVKWKQLVATFSAGNVALEAEVEHLRAELRRLHARTCR